VTKFNFTLHNEEHFLGQVSLAVKNIFGVELHGLKNGQKGPEKIGVIILKKAEFIDDLKVTLLDNFGSY